jgi:hypothetical protein
MYKKTAHTSRFFIVFGNSFHKTPFHSKGILRIIRRAFTGEYYSKSPGGLSTGTLSV